MTDQVELSLNDICKIAWDNKPDNFFPRNGVKVHLEPDLTRNTIIIQSDQPVRNRISGKGELTHSLPLGMYSAIWLVKLEDGSKGVFFLDEMIPVD